MKNSLVGLALGMIVISFSNMSLAVSSESKQFIPCVGGMVIHEVPPHVERDRNEFTSMPTEMIVYVISFLEPRDILTLGCCSRLLRQIVDSSDFQSELWSREFVRVYKKLYATMRYDNGQNFALTSRDPNHEIAEFSVRKKNDYLTLRHLTYLGVVYLKLNKERAAKFSEQLKLLSDRSRDLADLPTSDLGEMAHNPSALAGDFLGSNFKVFACAIPVGISLAYTVKALFAPERIQDFYGEATSLSRSLYTIGAIAGGVLAFGILAVKGTYVGVELWERVKCWSDGNLAEEHAHALIDDQSIPWQVAKCDFNQESSTWESRTPHLAWDLRQQLSETCDGGHNACPALKDIWDNLFPIFGQLGTYTRSAD